MVSGISSHNNVPSESCHMLQPVPIHVGPAYKSWTFSWGALVVWFALLWGGYGIVRTVNTPLENNFFATRRAGVSVICGDHTNIGDPYHDDCRSAEDTVLQLNSWADLGSNTVAVLLLPTIGVLADRYGRKPFIAVMMSMFLIASGTLLVYILWPHSTYSSMLLYLHIVFYAFARTVNPVPLGIAYTADVLPPAHRAVSFAILMGTEELGLHLASYVAAVLDSQVSLYTSTGAILVAMLGSLSLRESVKRSDEMYTQTSLNPLRTLSILRRYPLFRWLTVLVLIFRFSFQGYIAIFYEYVIVALDFTRKQYATWSVLRGFAEVLVQYVCMGVLVRYVGERRTVAVGCFINTLALVGYCLATKDWMVYLAGTGGALFSVTLPALSALKSNHVSADEQGAVQGALFGARCLASGTAPLIFTALFDFFTSPDVHYPQGAMWAAAGIGVPAIFIALLLPPSPPTRGETVVNVVN